VRIKIVAKILVCISLIGAATLAWAQAPTQVGAWGPVQNLPWRPGHAILLPTGKVMLFSGSSEVTLWDPSDASLNPAPSFGYDAFCNGHSLTADGRVFFTGGQVTINVGLPNASFYDPATNTMSHVEDMNAGRYYPTMVSLANGATPGQKSKLVSTGSPGLGAAME
jgi:hypothetical protein